MFGPVLKKMVDPSTGTAYMFKVTNGGIVSYSDELPEAGAKIAYVYDNQIIPQETLPTLKAELKNIGLEAKARRIAVFYSQMAAFQAKTDYAFDLADGLAEQAVGQLSYEIDTEICDLLINAADEYAVVHPTGIASFSKTLPVGVNYLRIAA